MNTADAIKASPYGRDDIRANCWADGYNHEPGASTPASYRGHGITARIFQEGVDARRGAPGDTEDDEPTPDECDSCASTDVVYPTERAGGVFGAS